MGFLHYETIVGLPDTKAASGNNNNIVEYENLTGIEAGLLTTTRSSSIWTILISSDETGTSCLKEKESFIRSFETSRSVSKVMIADFGYSSRKLENDFDTTMSLLILFAESLSEHH